MSQLTAFCSTLLIALCCFDMQTIWMYEFLFLSFFFFLKHFWRQMRLKMSWYIQAFHFHRLKHQSSQKQWTSFARTWIKVDSQPGDLGSLFVLKVHVNLEPKYLIPSSLLFIPAKQSWCQICRVGNQTRDASLGLGRVYLKMCTCAQRHARCLIVSSNVLEIVERPERGSLTAWPLCACWHLLGHRTQKLNINSLIASHLSHTRWVPSKENVTSLP